ncbi:hypothetical protein ACFSC4_31490 [Deinococcus malanensis]|nr:hypothetical protein [Deinococcus malanensis]
MTLPETVYICISGLTSPTVYYLTLEDAQVDNRAGGEPGTSIGV